MNHRIDPKQKGTTPDFRTFYSESGFSIMHFFNIIQYPPGWYWESLLPDNTLANDITGPFKTEIKTIANARKWLSAKNKNNKSTPWYRTLGFWMLLMF